MPSALRIAVLAALLAVLAPAAASALPGDGSDGRCDGRRATAFERSVSGAQSFRRALGFRSDRPYVVSVLRDRRYRRSVREFGTALTPQEQLYVRDRWALSLKTDMVKRHAVEKAGEDFVSLRVEDDFPAGAYIAVRVAKDVDRYARELSGLGLPIRVIAAPFSEQELKAVAESIWPQHARLEAEGIWLSSWGPGTDEDRVVVSVISARADAIQVVEHFFGPAVRAEVIATRRYTNVCTPAGGYSASPRGRTLRVFWRTNGVFKLVSVKVRETARSVRIAIIERAPNGPVTLTAEEPEVLVKLRKPLGRRAVVDAETGRRLRRGERTRLRYRHAARQRPLHG